LNYRYIFIGAIMTVMVGCMPKNKITTKNFIATQSICIDGVAVNIDAAGCSDISTTTMDGEPGIKIRCEYMDQSSPWTYFSFHIIPATVDVNVAGWSIICSDPSATIYYSMPGVSPHTN
jgi:hypothetical protein